MCTVQKRLKRATSKLCCVLQLQDEQNEGTGSSGAGGGGNGQHSRSCNVRHKSSVTRTLFCVVRFTDDYKMKESNCKVFSDVLHQVS